MNKKTKTKSIFPVLLVLILICGCIMIFIPKTINIAEAAIGENKITTRISGTLNGTLLKQEDGSVTFNGNEIASAAENLSSMYVILQGAGGAGGYYVSIFNATNVYNGGGSGAFVLVKIDFTVRKSYNIESGYGGIPGSRPNGIASSLSSDKGKIIALGGYGAVYDVDKTLGGYIYTEGDIEGMSIEFKKDGQRGGYRDPVTPGEASNAFTISMYKNGKLTTKFFNHYVGGISQIMGGCGGAASPYGRGGNGGYAEILLDFEMKPENGKGYGAGGGGALMLGEHKGGNGGNGFIDIMG